MTTLAITARQGRIKALEIHGKAVTARPADSARPEFVSRRSLAADRQTPPAKSAYRLLSASIIRWIAGRPPAASRRTAD